MISCKFNIDMHAQTSNEAVAFWDCLLALAKQSKVVERIKAEFPKMKNQKQQEVYHFEIVEYIINKGGCHG